MDDESSSSSSDDDCYVNAAAKYKKAISEKIQYTEEKEDKIPDLYSVPYELTPSLKEKSTEITYKRVGSCTEDNVSDSSSSSNKSSKRRCRGNSNKSSDTDTVTNSSNCTSMNSTRSDVNAPILDTICLDDSFCDNNFSQKSDISDYILIGSPEIKKNQVEDENYNINVKIIWKSKDVIKLDIKRYEPVQKLFQYFAEMENVSEEHILLMKKDKIIRPTDTPVSLGLTIVDILEGGTINTNVINFDDQRKEKDKNVCKIKVQSIKTKQPIIVTLNTNESFNSVIVECSRKLEISPEEIKLYFDGDLIEANDTPTSLDIEQEACVDLHIVKV